jgi:phospholipid/cholesterol/gamma-HCH transport system substrate-binding protein
VEDKVKLGLVGAFVLLLGAALIGGVLWLAAGLRTGQALVPYQAFIEESVAGLNLQAPVKYLGVDVGKVEAIGIDPGNPRRVRLLFLVQRGTPIRQDSVAVLKAQGLTGIAYVEIDAGSAGSALLVAGADGQPPTIPFKLSLTARLESVLTAIVAQVDQVASNLNAMFDAGNRESLKALLADTAALAQALAAEKAALRAGIRDAALTAQRAARAAEQVAPLMARMDGSAAALDRMAQALSTAGTGAAQAVGQAADEAASGARQIRRETLPDVARLVAELQALAASLQRLSEQTTRHPSSLLLGRPAPPPGPGEPGAPP